eukprot:TRINITY_DN15145_c0_g3_i1.p3 TRINITY_DN15145_c0_g3~~TRINITY_DN15145_c0_g3_i1.p3  ORF type:complete len:103 (-),score=11.53 TRINITY_DN15145_c0_g3_i1:772-1080(-)
MNGEDKKPQLPNSTGACSPAGDSINGKHTCRHHRLAILLEHGMWRQRTRQDTSQGEGIQAPPLPLITQGVTQQSVWLKKDLPAVFLSVKKCENSLWRAFETL